MSAVLLLSNGHGEDLSAAAIGCELQRRGIRVEALPLVGQGHAFRQAGIPVLAPTRDFSSGGLGYTSLAARLTDLREGQLSYLLGLLMRLLRHRRQVGLVVAVGDVVPLLATWLSGCAGVMYLVAYSSHYEGRLRLPWPCGWLLRSRRLRAVWARDRLTAEDLSQQLGRRVAFLGNPFLDTLLQAAGARRPPQQQAAPRQLSVAVLPGSRLPEALGNLSLLLQVLARLPAAMEQAGGQAPRLQAALVGVLRPEAIAAMAAPLGWRLHHEAGSAPTGACPQAALVRGEQRLALHWSGFEALLAGSDLALAMSGTAAEQAVALGLPVLQVAGPGPQFTAGFAEAQRRLLGPGVRCAPGAAGDPATLAASARELAAMLAELADPQQGPRWRRELEATAAERLGGPGGSSRMAAMIVELITPSPSVPPSAR